MSVQVQTWCQRRLRDVPIGTYSLIAFNIAVYIAMALSDKAFMFYRHGLIPGELSLSALFTSTFMHTDLIHLSLNLMFLWLFGRRVEQALGPMEYLIFYIGSGFAASITHVAIVYAFMPAEFVHLPVVGASGAISGIIGIYTIRFFHKRIHLGQYAFPAAPMLLLWLILQGIMGIVSLYLGSYSMFDLKIQFRGVGYWSHFGGFVFGMLIASLTDMAKQGQKEYLMDGAQEALRRGTLLEVTRKFEWLLSSDPNDAFAAAELARTWALLEDEEQSVLYYKRAIDLYTKSRQIKATADRYDEMRRFWPEAMFDSETHFRLACLFEEHGEHLRAADAFAQLYCYRANCSEAEMAMLKSGQIQLTHLDRPELATAILERFLELYPESEWRKFAEQTLTRAKERSAEQLSEEGDNRE